MPAAPLPLLKLLTSMKPDDAPQDTPSTEQPPAAPQASGLCLILSLAGAGCMFYSALAAFRQEPAMVVTVVGIACMAASFLARPKAR